MVEPYVDEEVSWAIRAHQALRFYPDEANGYPYPDNYRAYFGEDYRPEPYIEAEYKRARAHKWYGTARMITVHDIYSFDPNVHVELEEFEDIVGRNFRQPEEGFGLRQQPVGAYVAHAAPADQIPVGQQKGASRAARPFRLGDPRLAGDVSPVVGAPAAARRIIGRIIGRRRRVVISRRRSVVSVRVVVG